AGKGEKVDKNNEKPAMLLCRDISAYLPLLLFRGWVLSVVFYQGMLKICTESCTHCCL
ncbi:hypothetical protein P7K49_019010, partial [Saguinus oedipus]